MISANGTSDKKYSGQECIAQGTSTSDIDARMQEIVTKRASDTSVDQGEEEAENNSGFELGNSDDGGDGENSTGNVGSILEWANSAEENNASVGDPCYVIGDDLKNLLSSAFWIISVVGIILVVVMTTLSFIKAMVGSDDEKFRDAIKHLYTRIIVVIILLMLPMLLNFIINLINNSMGEGTYTIGSDGDVFCEITDN